MIVFYGDDLELNVTKFKIKFIEESSFFYDAFYKSYTNPFQISLDDEIAQKFNLINEDNICNYKIKYVGNLLIDKDFFPATLVIEKEIDYLEATIYYGKENLTLLEKKLSELPFPTIASSSVTELAETYLDKSWPEVPCNFPMVFDDDFNNTKDYEAFEGVVNSFDGASFKTNTIDLESEVFNKNIMVPFPYVMEILKVAFNSVDLKIKGGFVNRKENNHLLFDVKKHLEKFSSSTGQDFQFNEPTDQFIIPIEGIISEYKKEISISILGTYKLNIALNLPTDLNLYVFTVKNNSTVIFESTSRAIQEELTINKEDSNSTDLINVSVQLTGNANSILNFNNFSFNRDEGKLNLFKNTFSLSEVLPDLTVAGFLEKLKNWLNLRITFSSNYVTIDYVEEIFDTISFTDKTSFEVETPERIFNQIKTYQLQTENPTTQINVGAKGLVSTVEGLREEDIRKIETGVSFYQVEERLGFFTAIRKADAEFGIFLYNGKNTDGLPVAATIVEGCSFSLLEIYTKYWKRWLYFRLNSETYIDRFTANALENFTTAEGRFKYNKKHLIKTISKERISEEEFLYEIESETL